MGRWELWRYADTPGFPQLLDRIRKPPQRIDNTLLHAGSPMYHYCRLCRHLAAVLSETMPAPKFCVACAELAKILNVTPGALRRVFLYHFPQLKEIS